MFDHEGGDERVVKVGVASERCEGGKGIWALDSWDGDGDGKEWIVSGRADGVVRIWGFEDGSL